MDKTITISEETYEKLKDQLAEEGFGEVEVDELDDFIGQKLFIRTVTYHCVGEVVKRVGRFFELKGASWVADSGRFMDALESGELDEVEPTGQQWVSIDTIVDMFPWNHKLPIEQK